MIPVDSQQPSPFSIPPSPSSILPPPISKLSNSKTGTAESPLSVTISFRPYYSPLELVQLIKLQASSSSRNSDESSSSSHNNNRKELSEVRVEAWRQLACGFIERVGGRLGFPRRTIATAQTLYHRFHLHFHLREFAYQDVSISALLVASKLEDTLKKLREIQNSAWQVNNQLEGGTGLGEGDTSTQEAHRPHLIAIERLILQTVCFNFNLHRSPTVPTPEQLLGGVNVLPEEQAVGGKDVFGWVVRFGRAMSASKEFTFLAHLLAIDVHRTLAPLSYPPHTVALACLYLASYLAPSHKNSQEWRGEEITKESETLPSFEEGWCGDYESIEEDVEEIAHSLLNLFIQLCPPPNLTTSSSKPSPTYSPSPFPTSPSDTPPIASTSTSMTPSAARNLKQTSEKSQQLLQSGIPHTLTTIISSGTGFSSGIAARSEEEFTRVKIALRGVENKRNEDYKSRKLSIPMKGDKMKGKGENKGGKKEIEEVSESPKEIEGEKQKGRVERWRGGEEGLEEVVKKRKRKLEGGAGGGEEKRPVSVRYQF